MTQYDKNWAVAQIRDHSGENWRHILAQVFRGAASTRICGRQETEKYAPRDIFFQRRAVEKPFAGEERILVPSPKVADVRF